MQDPRPPHSSWKNFVKQLPQNILSLSCLAVVAYYIHSTGVRWIAAVPLASLACIVCTVALFLLTFGIIGFGEKPGRQAARRREADRREAQRRRDLAS
jgi:CBS domain containing-hemolysin-like protein